jgi:hypothetical protein
MGRAIEMDIEFTGYERPRRLASSTHMSWMDTQGGLTFDPVPEGTRMRWAWDLKPRGMLKVMGPLIARTGRRGEQTIWGSLKHLLEARDDDPVGPGSVADRPESSEP